MARRKRLTPVPMGLGDAGGAGDGASNVTDLPLPQAPPDARNRVPIAADAGAAASEAALAEMATHLEAARSEGRLAIALPLESTVQDHLTRDRIAIDKEEMTTLIDSIATRGQQTPIEVVALAGEGNYGLISGWRRLQALRHLSEVTGEDRFGTVLAVLRQPANAAEAYVAMVEENEIRANLSHYERARIVAQAVRQGVYPDTRRALRNLFGMASRSRRSKIGSFLAVVDALDDVLRFPTALPERLGLTLARTLEAEEGAAARLSAALAQADPQTAEAEQAVLKAALTSPRPDPPSHETEHGIVYLSEADGSLVLRGPGVTTAFRSDLITWLNSRDTALDEEAPRGSR